MPNLFSDADGRYRGLRQCRSISARPGHAVYANFSGWDIYRTEAPLLALIEPQRIQDMCQSIALMYAQGGWIDRWPQANTYTNVMCGSPLTIVAATGWNYGPARLRHRRRCTRACSRTPRSPRRPASRTRASPMSRLLDKIGYIPDDKEGYGSVSQTEEDCLAYAALASVADVAGHKADAACLRRRALFYRNLFDPETKFLRPRPADGSWYAPFDPTQEHGYVEGTGWHYRWLAAAGRRRA